MMFKMYKIMRQNRKGQILQLQAVSKCKKQKSNTTRKYQSRKLNINIELIPNLDDQYDQPTIQVYANMPGGIGQFNSKYNQSADRSQQLLYHTRDFQDSNLTKHISQQLLILKIIMMIMAVLSILLARLGEDAAHITIFSINGETVVLAMHSLITVTLVIMAIIKNFKCKQLTIKQLIRFSPYQINPLGITKWFIIQLLYLSIHPNLLSQKTLTVTEPVSLTPTSLPLNNLLQIIMLFRVYLLYSAIVSSTIYLSTRGSRICRIYGTKCDLYFGFKCLFNTRPLLFLIVIFGTMLFVFGEMVRLSQESFGDAQLGNFGNSLWCVMITMGTVGYGDYYPQTYLGRIVLFFASITGIIVASLLILTLSTYLSMELSQNKAHITMHRLVLRDKLEYLAKSVMLQAATISKLPPVSSSSSGSSLTQSSLKSLKKRTEDVKYTLRKIKNLIDTDNVNEEMDRLFETLQDNMKDAYINQLRYLEALEEMQTVQADKIEEMRFSFTQEIQNIIRDR